jgi:hypothetical protein
MEWKQTIIAITGAKSYLEGVSDIDGNFSALPRLGNVAVCTSLSAAK